MSFLTSHPLVFFWITFVALLACIIVWRIEVGELKSNIGRLRSQVEGGIEAEEYATALYKNIQNGCTQFIGRDVAHRRGAEIARNRILERISMTPALRVRMCGTAMEFLYHRISEPDCIRLHDINNDLVFYDHLWVLAHLPSDDCRLTAVETPPAAPGDAGSADPDAQAPGAVESLADRPLTFGGPDVVRPLITPGLV